MIGFMFFIMGIYYWILPKIMIKNPMLTKGTIISAKTAVPEQMKKNNSKWALIEIYINNDRYVSAKKLQVPMDSEIGDTIEIIYDENDPENMAIRKRNRIVIMFILIGTILIMYGLYLKKVL